MSLEKNYFLIKINPAYSCFQYYQWFCTATESRTQTVPYESSDSHAYCKGISFVSCTGKLLPIFEWWGFLYLHLKLMKLKAVCVYNINISKYLQIESLLKKILQILCLNVNFEIIFSIY